MTIPSCDNCGACCREIGTPPFLEFEIYDLPELLRDEVREKGTGSIYDDDKRDGKPCYWLNQDTGQCQNYDHRPQLCRDFEVGSDSCINYRRYYNLEDFE